MSLDIGIHTIPEVLYHADPCATPSLSNSIIKLLLNATPDHAMRAHPKLNPGFAFSMSGDGSDGLDNGTVAHGLLLEGHDKARVVEADSWRSAKAKEQRSSIERAGHIAMLAKQYDSVMGMVVAARDFIGRSPMREAWNNAKPEQTIIWVQDRVLHRGRIDKLYLGDKGENVVCFDYKSTKAESPDDFMRSSTYCRFGYDTQAELYSQGIQELGYQRPRFWFLVQESFEPYRCYWVENSEARSELAAHKIARARRLWAECLKADQWPGYPVSQVFQAEPTKWELSEEDSL